MRSKTCYEDTWAAFEGGLHWRVYFLLVEVCSRVREFSFCPLYTDTGFFCLNSCYILPHAGKADTWSYQGVITGRKSSPAFSPSLTCHVHLCLSFARGMGTGHGGAHVITLFHPPRPVWASCRPHSSPIITLQSTFCFLLPASCCLHRENQIIG